MNQLDTDMNQLDTDMNWHEITGKLLKRECSAVETYRQVLHKAREELGQNAEFQELATILSDHQQAASRLEAQIQQPERRADGFFGGWGTWSKVVMGAASIFGDSVVLRALKAGEESGCKRYQEVLEATTAIPAELKPLFLGLLAKQQAHIRTLDGLMSKRVGLPV
ncbi:MAG: PA2169 family four-helix-bundle protein [Pseudomonadota bacterium]|nr:PA2169 family four-helix-bundle protein [Pseudomonadota bacterium]